MTPKLSLQPKVLLDLLRNQYSARNRDQTMDEKRSLLGVNEHRSPSLTMSLSARRYFAAGLLFYIGLGTALCAGGWCLFKRLGVNPVVDSVADHRSTVLTGLWLSRMDEQGRLTQHLQSYSAIYCPNTHIVTLIKPILTVFSSIGAIWKLSAQEGQWHTAQQKLVLHHQVLLEQFSAADKRVLSTLHTQYLNLQLDAQTATTLAPVRWIQPEQWLTGVGAYIDFRARMLSIHSQLRVEFRSKPIVAN